MRFLDDKVLGREVATLLQGENVRCAVAFWGTGAVQRLFTSSNGPKQARIVCDISLGATNPEELEAMGAPSNASLKHLKRLHAKVYMSTRGAIVCSANASDNGIGFQNLAGLVEAGVFIETTESAYSETEAWFEKIWKLAKVIRKHELAEATDAWKRRPRQRGGSRLIPTDAPSLFGTVAANPDNFRGIGFAFTTGNASRRGGPGAYRS